MIAQHTLARLALSLGAGLAAALLFVVPQKGTSLAFLIAYFAPLPIMIAALGWGHLTGLAAVVFGALALALALNPLMAPLFAIAIALPAWWLCFVTLRGQSGAKRRQTVGEIVAWGAALSAAIAFAGCTALVLTYGSYGEALTEISLRIAPMLESIGQALGDGAPGGADLARALLGLAPAAMAASSLLMLLINLWFAARIVEMSHRLPRAWAPIPENLILPAGTAAVFAVGLAAMALPGFIGVIGMILASAAGLALALHGLAVLHAASRGRSWRVFMLAALYSFSLVITPLPFALALIIALADIFFTLRRARAAPPSPQT